VRFATELEREDLLGELLNLRVKLDELSIRYVDATGEQRRKGARTMGEGA
jgi:hypothetical protein